MKNSLPKKKKKFEKNLPSKNGEGEIKNWNDAIWNEIILAFFSWPVINYACEIVIFFPSPKTIDFEFRSGIENFNHLMNLFVSLPTKIWLKDVSSFFFAQHQ